MQIRPVTRRDVKQLADVLSEAFVDDPISLWLFGGDDRYAERLRVSFTNALKVIYMPKGYSFTTSDLAGAALWAPPGNWKMSVATQLRLAPAMTRLLGVRRAATKAAPFGRLIENAHPDEPHWYLAVLGVDPAKQRSGVGTALVRPMLDRADGDGTLAYLETSKPDNLPYYKRFGFQVSDEIQMPEDGPKVWTMTRRPLG